MKKTFFCLILCSILIVLAACDNGGRSERPRGRLQVQENDGAIEVRAPDGTVLVKGNQESASILLKPDGDKGGNANISSGNLAPGFPADVPMLSECTVVMSQVFQGGRNAIATITSQQPAENVISFYEEQIPRTGWAPGSRYNLDNIVMLNGKNGAANLNVSITTDAGVVTVNIARTESTEK